MKQSFGVNELGLADLPIKISNVRLAWVLHTLLGLRFSFPHGKKTPDSSDKKDYRSWRFYRHRQDKLKPVSAVEI